MSQLAARISEALQGRYVIERELGRGGMAVVYLGRDLRYDRVVAIKVMHPEIMASVGRDRFMREVRIAARLSHPHILPLFDSGEAEGLLFYVMPRIDGESLRARLTRQRTLAIDEAVRLGIEVASGLAHAHAQGVVHRDVKPENILLAGDTAVLADFGIAQAMDVGAGRLTGTGLFVGSPAYMSPEQTDGVVDHRADVYALGCVLYEMLAGAPPFSGSTFLGFIAGHAGKPVPALRARRAEVSGELEAVVLRALAKRPDDRFATAHEFAVALGRIGTGTVTGIAAPVVEPVPRTIAILPFEDLTPARDQEYFCEGIAEELRTTLARVAGLQVISRRSSTWARDRSLDIRAIGTELGVSHVLEGTVRSAVDRLRVTVTLTTAADGIQVWSERYDRKMDDVFEIQDDITRRVGAALRIHLTSVMTGPNRGTRNLEAYRAYLRGRQLWNRRTERALRQSIAHMQEAIGLDSSYAEAHAGLADSLVTLGIYGVSPPAEVMPAALDAARRALELDPALAEALVVRGAVHALRDWDWGAAERDFRQATQLDPRYATGHHWYANHVLMPQGRFEEASRALASALELDPGAPTVVISRSLLFALQGDAARSIEQLQELLDRDPELAVAHYFLGQVYDREERFGEARAALSQALAFGGESPEVLAMLAYTDARAGHTGEARSGYERLVELGASRYVSPALLALVRLGIGDTDGALGFLEKAVEVRATELVWLKVRWCYDPLRELPRFQAVVGRVGG